VLTSRDQKIANELKEVTGRLAEDLMYQLVIDEIERSDLDPVAKVQALEEAEGDEAKANAFYPKHRIRRVHDMIKAIALEAETERLKEEKTENLKLSSAKKANFRWSTTKFFNNFLVIIFVSFFFFSLIFSVIIGFQWFDPVWLSLVFIFGIPFGCGFVCYMALKHWWLN